MKKTNLIISLIFIFLSLFLIIRFWSQWKKEKPQFFSQVIFYNSQSQEIARFKVELATTSAQHREGLMYRDNLPPDQGMLFIFPEEKPLSFWMKNTHIPLDIIYFSQEKEVIFLVENVPPCQREPCPGYPTKIPAQYVLEINGGLSQKLGIKKGTKAIFSLN